MKNHTVLSLLLILLCILTGFSPVLARSQQRASQIDGCIPGEFVVAQSALAAHTRAVLSEADKASKSGYRLAEFSTSALLLKDRALTDLSIKAPLTDLCGSLKRNHRSLRRENNKRRALGARSLLVAPVVCSCNRLIHISAVPSDTSLSSQWATADNAQYGISLAKAWDSFTGSNDVLVGILDSGINYKHPDLAANIWSNPKESIGNSADDDGDGYVDDIHGINAITNSGDPLDDDMHGSHVAGIIGAVGDNKLGVAGVNWRVKMVGAKFISSEGYGSSMNAIKGIDYLTELKKRGENLVAVNGSFGSYYSDGAELASLSKLRDAGVLFVAAAGNESKNIDSTPMYPASYALSNIIPVAATQKDGRIAQFPYDCFSLNPCVDTSNYGPRTVPIAAPGKDIYSTVLGSEYTNLSGTSMAAPYVTGALALLAGYDPALSSAQLKSILLAGASTDSSLANYVEKGRLLNVAAMLENAASSHFVSVGGSIFDASGNSISDAYVIITKGAQTFTRKSDASGKYKAYLETGDYTVTPYKAGVTFEPRSRLISIGKSSITDSNFTGAVASPHKISGAVTSSTLARIPSVRIDAYIGSFLVASTKTDAQGAYSFPSVFSPGVYRIVVSRPAYTFLPDTVSVTVENQDIPLSFTITKSPTTYTIGGRVSTYLDEPLPNTSVHLSANYFDTEVDVTTDANGQYVLSGLESDTYAVSVPTYTNDVRGNQYSWAPPSATVALTKDNLATNFVYQRVSGSGSIQGTVVDILGAPASGVQIDIFSGTRRIISVITDRNGFYKSDLVPMIPPPDGYKVVPSEGKAYFDPPNRRVNGVASWNSINFTKSESLPPLPTIAESPSDYESYQGLNDHAVFNCTAKGFATNIVWEISDDGKSFTPTNDFKLETFFGPNSYRSSQLGTTYIGQFIRCGASNPAGTVYSKPVTTRYIPFPTIAADRLAIRASETAKLSIIGALAKSIPLRWDISYAKGSVTCTDSGVSNCSAQINGDATVSLYASSSLSSNKLSLHLIPEAPARPTLVVLSGALCSGSTVTLNGYMGGATEYRWRKDGVEFARTNSGVLDLTLKYSDRNSVFTVIAANEGGVSQESAPLTLKVLPKIPTFIKGLSDTKVELLDPANLSVAIDSDDDVVILWMRNESVIPGVTGTIYSIPSASEADGSTYLVSATNSIGEKAVTSAILTVTPPAPPKITVQPQSQSVTISQSATLSVTAVGKLLKYQWYRENKAVDGATSNSLTISPGVLTTSYYYVRISNPGGSAQSDTVSVMIAPPTITSPPVPVTVNEGEDATFSVVASGSGLSYQWSKNTVEIAGATGPSYTVKAASRQLDGSYYSVEISNSTGVVISPTARLNVRYQAPITIRSQPKSVAITAGSSATFSVDVVGSGVTYQWYRDGVILGGATQASYTISNVGMELNGAKFKVRVSNSTGGSAESSEAILTVTQSTKSVPSTTTTTTIPPQTFHVVSAPQIQSQPSLPSGGAKAGGVVTLSVTAVGEGMTYQWQRNGSDISGATGASFTFTPHYSDTAAKYRVKVINSGGTVLSSEVALVVHLDLHFTKDLSPKKSVKSGAKIVLSALASALDGAPVSYQWYKNGKVIRNATKPKYTLSKVSSKNNKARFTVVATAGSESVTSTVLKLAVK